jgi:hypothetical protein
MPGASPKQTETILITRSRQVHDLLHDLWGSQRKGGEAVGPFP